MIDTNAIHRGSDHHASEGARRLVVLIELVERRTKLSYYEVFNQRLESHPYPTGMTLNSKTLDDYGYLFHMDAITPSDISEDHFIYTP